MSTKIKILNLKKKKIITLNDNLSFKKKSGDNNKIHYDKKFTKKLLVSTPIVHGCNIFLKVFFKNFFLEKDFFIPENIKIEFKNFLCINEPYKIKCNKLGFIIFSGQKIFLSCKFKKKKIEVSNKDHLKKLKELFLDISNYIGNEDLNAGSLILKIEIISGRFEKSQKKLRSITNFLKYSNIANSKYKAKVLSTKLVLYEKKINKQLINNFKKKFNNKNFYQKKFMVFGASGNLGSTLVYIFKKMNVNFYKVHASNKNVCKKNDFFIQLNSNGLKFLFKKVKPDFIFYFFSPSINQKYSFKINKRVQENFDNVYFTFLKKVILKCNQLKFKSRIFNPSSIALELEKNEKFRYSKEYINSKKKSEKLIKFSNKNVKLINYRLPQFQGPNNYNLAGFFEGKKHDYIFRYLDNFLK